MPVRIFLIIFCATVARFLLVLNLPIRFLPNNVHDDGLFMRLATNLASRLWLGDLNQFTFLKGPGYPAFLAVASVSGLPLSAAHALFQAAAISAVLEGHQDHVIVSKTLGAFDKRVRANKRRLSRS